MTHWALVVLRGVPRLCQAGLEALGRVHRHRCCSCMVPTVSGRRRVSFFHSSMCIITWDRVKDANYESGGLEQSPAFCIGNANATSPGTRPRQPQNHGTLGYKSDLVRTSLLQSQLVQPWSQFTATLVNGTAERKEAATGLSLVLSVNLNCS